MKATALALALFVTAGQSVIASDCCCVIICRHQSEVCSKCANEAPVQAQADCCKGTRPAPAPADEKRCSHLEPSSEILQQAPVAVTAPPNLDLELPPAIQAPPVPAPDKADGQDCPARGSPPLHLLHSVLLI